MFDSIHGRVSVREPARVVIEAGGLGYLLHVPLSTYEVLPAVGAETRLLLHLVVREDEWRLYGFSSARERDTFRDLLRVAGVGPAVALTLLSGLGPHGLLDAVTGHDAKALQRVKGVGAKTAERVVLDLKDRWGKAAPGGPGGATPAGPLADALRALEALGLERGEAERRLERLGAAERALPLAELVRKALRA